MTWTGNTDLNTIERKKFCVMCGKQYLNIHVIAGFFGFGGPIDTGLYPCMVDD